MEIELEVSGSEDLLAIYSALKVEGPVELRSGRLYMRFECSDDSIAQLRAMVNTWLRLLKIASEMVELVKEYNQ